MDTSEVRRGRPKGSRNSPRRTPESVELKAMLDAFKILQPLSAAQRERALEWLAHALIRGGALLFTTPVPKRAGERDQDGGLS